MTIHIGRREFISALWSGVVMWSLAARAQQPHRIRRLGVLMAAWRATRASSASANQIRICRQSQDSQGDLPRRAVAP